MAIQSLTRIYMVDLSFDEEKFGRSTAYFPFVGLIIGIFLFSIYAVSIKYYPPLVIAALLMVGNLLITGGMHLDGFIDTMDGLFSGRKKERILEIMKDSRVGANGVVAVAVLFLLKFSLLFSLVQMDYKLILASLVVMATLSRWAQVYAIKYFHYLPKEGLGTLYKSYTNTKEFLIASLIALITTVTLLKVTGLVIFLTTLGITFFIATRVVKTIGGLTGDIYGAINELIELIILLILISIW